MADSILTQITMAGGAINLAFNNIEASYSDGSFHSWATNASMMIIYYSTQRSLVQPVLITKYMYDTIVSSYGSSYLNVAGWYSDNNGYFSIDVVYIYGSASSNASKFLLRSNSWCILVS